MEIKIYKPENHKIKAVIYGSSGTGKTTFGATAPNPIFASAEAGMLSIQDKEIPFVEIKSLANLSELLMYLKKEEHDYQTIVIDSITEINDIIKTEIEAKTGKAMQLQDWGVLSKKIKAILRGFRDLPMNVIFIAQENNIVDEDKIHKIVPSLNGKSATDIAYFMDVVGYIQIEKATKKRLLTTSSDDKLLTKDRSGKIGDNCLDFTEWVNKVKGVETGEQEIVKDLSKPKLPDEDWK